MKKNYTRPVVEVKVFDFEDVVMASTDPVNNSMNAANYAAKKSAFTTAATTAGAIVVEW